MILSGSAVQTKGFELSKGGRSLLRGRGDDLNTVETEGQMVQRVMPDLMGMKNILVLNDEAHHCYREKPKDADEEELKGDDKKEAEKNNEAARVWISGLEVVNRKLGISHVIDLSATHRQRPADYVFSQHVELKLAEIREAKAHAE
jgi:type III restriction enzyme